MKRILFIIILFFTCSVLPAQRPSRPGVFAVKPSENRLLLPPATDRPWVFWYWMQAAVSREGITADLEAMKAAGIGGAYLMPIKDTAARPWLTPPVRQLSPEWWQMVRFAMQEAKRLGLQLGMHVSDGFALAGGPWITPEQSMQKIVWSSLTVDGGGERKELLPGPAATESYYRDIAIYAYPAPAGAGMNTRNIIPVVTNSKNTDAHFLAVPGNKQSFGSNDSCWIQYAFDRPFTCRTITIRTGGNSYQAQRLLVLVSGDGVHFRSIGRLGPPRHGWQDTDADVTHDIPAVTAKYFRFVYNKEGSEPGAEDLDAAKWKPSVKLTGIELSAEPSIHQFEGKNGEIWRISKRTTREQVPDSVCVPLDKIINVTKYFGEDGRLHWNIPPGKWVILRIGHTSTGHKNETAGGGKGLECDKFDPATVQWQFDNWFGKIFQQVDSPLVKEVLKIFHVDSWECGSQNWSPVFAAAFRKKRGYDLTPYLPIMTGLPVQNVDVSEGFLYDVRQTITELLNENFYGTLAKLAHRKGCSFSAESVAPTMLSDGMLHYSKADIPMGEFWLNSPTHDKPNDMLDAISGAHIYGRPIIQAEAFTTLRMTWGEYPGMLKALGDRTYALGINRLVYHVFTHNPWPARKPGMTLDGIGLYFQANQTWWKPGSAWVAYAQRCQQLLQKGKPVTDIAVFTGEELPRRSVLPDRLVPTLPDIMDEDIVEAEISRLANKGEPLEELPAGVWHSANMARPEVWTDPLQGYKYDSFNPDVLMHAAVRNGRIVLPGGASYRLLILPPSTAMNPDATLMTPAVAGKLLQLVRAGATILLTERPAHSPSLAFKAGIEWNKTVNQLWPAGAIGGIHKAGKGMIIAGSYYDRSFDAFGIQKDVIVQDAAGMPAKRIAWTHRADSTSDIYFISNQEEQIRNIEISLRVSGRLPELYDAVTGEIAKAVNWKIISGRTVLPLRMEPNGSLFILLRHATVQTAGPGGDNIPVPAKMVAINGPWQVSFDKSYGGPATPVTMDTLQSWSSFADSSIKYYSGTAVYTTSFQWAGTTAHRVWLDVGKVANIAAVKINGKDCGVAWTFPYRVDITKALHTGDNTLQIDVTNTWANRLIGDHSLPEAARITSTNAPYRLEGKPLLAAGLLGPVMIVQIVK